jgi:hypothetical protein
MAQAFTLKGYQKVMALSRSTQRRKKIVGRLLFTFKMRFGMRFSILFSILDRNLSFEVRFGMQLAILDSISDLISICFLFLFNFS